jgi:hypothetical protein
MYFAQITVLRNVMRAFGTRCMSIFQMVRADMHDIGMAVLGPHRLGLYPLIRGVAVAEDVFNVYVSGYECEMLCGFWSIAVIVHRNKLV